MDVYKLDHNLKCVSYLMGQGQRSLKTTELDHIASLFQSQGDSLHFWITASFAFYGMFSTNCINPFNDYELYIKVILIYSFLCEPSLQFCIITYYYNKTHMLAIYHKLYTFNLYTIKYVIY